MNAPDADRLGREAHAQRFGPPRVGRLAKIQKVLEEQRKTYPEGLPLMATDLASLPPDQLQSAIDRAMQANPDLVKQLATAHQPDPKTPHVVGAGIGDLTLLIAKYGPIVMQIIQAVQAILKADGVI